MTTMTQNPAAEALIERIEDADGVQTFEKIEAYGWERAYQLGRARVIITLEEVANAAAWVGVKVIDCDARGAELSSATFTNVNLDNLPRVEAWLGDSI